ncbi:MAG: gfo/Idh/MocA family oxidoreductase, partial [Verrucomicrobia bacterium]
KEAVDAVSIVAPDPAHAPLSIRCLEAGKHVLCEKPLALNHAEAERMVAAARRAGTITMVNFSYRNGAAIHLAATLVAAGRLGELRHIEASYLQSWLVCKLWGDWRTEPGWLWRLSKGHGSQGVLGDIGVHILDFATYPAGPIKRVFCRLKTFPKIPGDRVGDYQLDANDSAVMNVEFENGAIGTIHTTRWATGHINRLYLKLSGTKGSLEIDTERSDAVCRVCLGDDVETARWRERQAPAVPSNYARFIRAIQTGEPCEPDFERGAEIQRIIDACFASAEADRPVAL